MRNKLENAKVKVYGIKGIASIVRGASVSITMEEKGKQVIDELDLTAEQAVSLYKQLGRMRAVKDEIERQEWDKDFKAWAKKDNKLAREESKSWARQEKRNRKKAS